ncbi:MAG: DUF2344 domain-containing protein [Clostridia bacterium]|nr:DUF2344 domain-containing protein [Clostridia bacterium]
MRIIARFKKDDTVRFVSHLDVQRLFQRAFRRADLAVAYSNGFNPHQQLSFATALTVGSTSSAEWLDIKMDKEISADEFIERVNAVLPRGFRISEAACAEDKYPSLSAVMAAADYTVKLRFDHDIFADIIRSAIEKLLSDSIVVLKKTKAGMKNVDIRPMVYKMELTDIQRNECTIALAGRLDAAGGLNADLLLGAFKDILGQSFTFSLHRETIYSIDGAFMPKAPEGYPIQA